MQCKVDLDIPTRLAPGNMRWFNGKVQQWLPKFYLTFRVASIQFSLFPGVCCIYRTSWSTVRASVLLFVNILPVNRMRRAGDDVGVSDLRFLSRLRERSSRSGP